MDLGLIHYPVYNRNGEIVTTAVTNLDLHDIARAARTYGVERFYVATPLRDQQELVREILAHWLTGRGAEHNPKRREALSLVRICDDLAAIKADAAARWGERPVVLATGARPRKRTWSYGEARIRAAGGEPLLLVFGTGWGLAPEISAAVDGFLPPITGAGDFNHLSVRSAVAIVLDRLSGRFAY